MQAPYSFRPQRPRLSEARPHTVHASSSGGFAVPGRDDGFHDAEEDDQTTPRASLAGLSILAEAAERRLSRDDTAADMSELVHGESSSRAKHGDDVATFASWANNDPVWQFPSQPGLPTPATTSELPVHHAKPARSLGRKLSRSYKDRYMELRDTMTKHAPRMRRASTPHNVDTQDSQDRYQGHGTPAPLSPSKRNARYAENNARVRKFRSAFGLPNHMSLPSSGDRKDTPAPPAWSVAAHPAPRPSAAAHPLMLSGGEGARKAAAAHNNPHYFDDDDSQREELQARRGRVGSNSTAADSGADLSRSDYHSCEDSASDMSDTDSKMDVDGVSRPQKEPKKEPIDFVKTRKLPAELCLQIFQLLDAPDLERAKWVGPEWRALCEETSVWRAAYLRRFGRHNYTTPEPIQVGGVGAGRPGQPQQQWKDMYKARMELNRNWRKGARDAGKAIYLSGHTDSVYCLQFDEEKIITGSRDRTIRVWDINTFQCIRVIGGPNVRPVAGPKLLRTVDYPSFHLATASVNGTTYGNNIYHVPSQWHDASILCLQYDHEILVTGSSDSSLLIWDIKTYQPIARLDKRNGGHNGGVLDVALDAKHIISCSKDSRIIVWDRKTFQPKGELTGHRGPVNAVQLRGKLLVSASGDGIARLWDIEQLKLVKEFSQKERGLAAVEFSEDMKYVLAGGNDHITYKFEVETGREILQFTGHSQLVRSLWLDSANNRVVSGSYDLDLRVYDFVTGQEIWRAEEWTTSWMLAAKSDYRRIVATSQDGRILIIDFGLKKGGSEDGQPIENVDLLRAVENTNAIVFRNVNWEGGR